MLQVAHGAVYSSSMFHRFMVVFWAVFGLAVASLPLTWATELCISYAFMGATADALEVSGEISRLSAEASDGGFTEERHKTYIELKSRQVDVERKKQQLKSRYDQSRSLIIRQRQVLVPTIGALLLFNVLAHVGRWVQRKHDPLR